MSRKALSFFKEVGMKKKFDWEEIIENWILPGILIALIILSIIALRDMALLA